MLFFYSNSHILAFSIVHESEKPTNLEFVPNAYMDSYDLFHLEDNYLNLWDNFY